MLKPDPTRSRQLAEAGPIFLWRDRAAGGREGLVLASHACTNPACACRDVIIEGWLADEKTLGVFEEDHAVHFTVPQGTPSGRRVLRANVDIDHGVVEVSEGRTTTEPWALEWLRSTMDAELLAILKRRFAAAKHPPATPRDWRDEDWSWWRPGSSVAWIDVSSDDEATDVLCDGKTYVVTDLYCVDPGCACEEICVSFALERSPGQELEEVGDVWVNPTFPTAAQLHAHGAKRVLVDRLWRTLCNDQPITALLLRRRTSMRELAPEIHRLFGKPAPASVGKVAANAPAPARHGKVGANEPCPCGSGKKYKRCCKGK